MYASLWAHSQWHALHRQVVHYVMAIVSLTMIPDQHGNGIVITSLAGHVKWGEATLIEEEVQTAVMVHGGTERG